MSESHELRTLVLLGDVNAAVCQDETCTLSEGVGHSARSAAESDASDNG